MIGVLSDAHGNGPAFSRSIDVLRRYGATSFVYLGDATGYIPSPDVVRMLHALGDQVLCIQGNHEKMLLELRVREKPDEVYQLGRVRDKLSTEAIRFIESWPTHRIRTYGRSRVLFVHGSPADFTHGYVYPDTDLTSFTSSFDIVFMGHTHRAFKRMNRNVLYVNVGSCGLPRDDGRFGAGALFDEKTKNVRLLRFDITAATKKVLIENPTCHESVASLFERRGANLRGEIVE